MNRTQTVALVITLANLVLILLIPPFDYLSVSRGSVPTFEGFSFFFSREPNRVVNASFLYLEIFVVLTNGMIAWLLGSPRRAPGARRFRRPARGTHRGRHLPGGDHGVPAIREFRQDRQGHPAFVRRFLFRDWRQYQTRDLTAILCLEMTFVLVNGAIFWLLLKDRGRTQLSANEIRRLSTELKKSE
jgi:hypothetical protein